MVQVRASAPGKLVIVGEYAVLHGGSAIAVAVDRRAEALLITGTAKSELCIANSNDNYGFELTASGLRWHQDPGAHGELLEAALKVLGRSGAQLHQLAPFSLRLDSQQFFSDVDAVTAKLGLGSSAAIAVALSGCLQHAFGEPVDAATALAVHREFQHGKGSGVDVCTSYHGGTISLGANKGAVSALVWPEQLHILPVWTGKAASTQLMLKQLDDFAAAYPERHTALLGNLSALSVMVLQACERADISALQAALVAFTDELHMFDEATGLGIWSAEHIQLAGLAAEAGLIYKPSGAGGGDFGLAFATDRDALDRFQQRAEQAGFGGVGFKLGVEGLELG